MNRIYFGKAIVVETPDGKDHSGSARWLKLADWESAVWRHHGLFQDAVNYYTLALAALARGLKPDSPKAKAALAWRAQVRDSWLSARRRAVVFVGPHERLAEWLGVPSEQADAGRAFDECAAALLKDSSASADALAKALLQMLDEVEQADLNQFCVSRLPWLCTPHGKLDATPKNVAQPQETRMLATVLEIHEAPAEQRAGATKRDPRVAEALESQLRGRLKLAPELLERIAHRILPLRGRSWHWDRHPATTEKNALHHLTQNGPSLDRKERPVWLRGQRGLSIERIEQVEELRKRFQSLNQTQRREIGGRPPMRRDESVPDPRPDLLEKLDNLKEQRVNQTAHMILAEALGLRLASPPANKKALRLERDQHGVYEKILNQDRQWIGPVDFIVIEDLSRYRASQGRAPRENSRLMKWCHRAVRDKLRQLCEVFGLAVLETPAAYSSRFCSRSGVPGFRAEEVTAGFTQQGQWAWLANKKEESGQPTAEAARLRQLDDTLTHAQKELETDWGEKKRSGPCPQRTLLVPIFSGPVFVPIVGAAAEFEIQPAIAQADINAAINLALRAMADPKLWAIHPRLRTQREKKDDSLVAREKRKFGEKNPPRLSVTEPEKPIADTTRNPNYFADFAELKKLAEQLVAGNDELKWLTKEWTSASLPPDRAASVPLLHSKSLWGTVKHAQWKRIEAINAVHLAEWRDKLNPRPG